MPSHNDDSLDRAADWIWVAALFGAAIWALRTLVYQIYFWLRWGHWQEMPVSIAFHWLGADLSAVYAPQSWHGAATAARWFLDLPLGLIGALLLIWIG